MRRITGEMAIGSMTFLGLLMVTEYLWIFMDIYWDSQPKCVSGGGSLSNFSTNHPLRNWDPKGPRSHELSVL